jgi:hypothetical protein
MATPNSVRGMIATTNGSSSCSGSGLLASVTDRHASSAVVSNVALRRAFSHWDLRPGAPPGFFYGAATRPV